MYPRICAAHPSMQTFPVTDSRISGFYRKTIDQRIDELVARGLLDFDAAGELRARMTLLSADTADKMIENVIGVFGLPFAVAPNFLVNGKWYIAPMVVEEPSIVAGVSGAAKLFAESGGFTVTASESLLAGQVQVPRVSNPGQLIEKLIAHEADLWQLPADTN